MKTMIHNTLLTFMMLAMAPAGSQALADDATSTAFDQILERYETVRLALTNDTADGVAEQSQEIEAILQRLAADWSPAAAGIQAELEGDVRGLIPELSKAAAALTGATSLDAARDAFYDLSKPLVRWRKAANSMATGDRPTVAYCSMAKRSWLQPKGDIGNPYYGQSMLRCGETVDG